jgi:hypothetical protein
VELTRVRVGVLLAPGSDRMPHTPGSVCTTSTRVELTRVRVGVLLARVSSTRVFALLVG